MLVLRGEVLEECPLTIGVVMSDLEIPELAAGMESMEQKMKGLGCTLDSPLVTLGFISFSGIPFARLTPRGLYDVRKGKIVFPGEGAA